MRIATTLFLACALVGCSGTYERMAAWMGASKGAVLTAFDRHPDATGRTALGNWMRWSRQEDRGCSDRFTFRDDRVVGYASDCGIWGGFSAPKAPPPTSKPKE
jgi:hypothetical protein